MGLTSCQEYEAGFTAADIIRGTYARKFVEKHGAIDPEETWDLSTAGGRRSGGSATRTASPYTSVASDDGYYYLPDAQLKFMKDNLPEQNNNSGIMQPFEMSWEEGNVFEVIPIYEGYASLRWRLGIKIIRTDGTSIEKTIWEKPNEENGSDDFQVVWNAVPTLVSNDEISVFYETTEEAARIWAWGNDVVFPTTDFEKRPYMTRIGCNGLGKFVYKYTFSGSKIPTNVKFDTKDLAFVNHGYYYAGGDRSARTISDLYNVNSTYKGSTTTWTPFKGTDDGAYAAQFRSKPKLSTEFLGDTDIPAGSKVFFYLEIINGGEVIPGTPVGTKQFSNNKQMTLLECPPPSNISQDYSTYILGVEDVTLTTDKCDKDYNDIVFLIAGKVPDPVYYTEPVDEVTEKRYMCEDFTQAGDFDFNDIVIDVRQTSTTTFKPSTNPESFEVDEVTITQKAKVSWLCGTVPLTAKVGDHWFPLITNPSDQEQSIAQLTSSDYDYSECTWGDGTGFAKGYCPMGDDDWVEIEGWDPDANNISIYVYWDGPNDTKLENPTSIEGGSKVWKSTFPQKTGEVPNIIATNIDDPVTKECQDISETSWWQSHFRWSSPDNKQLPTAN